MSGTHHEKAFNITGRVQYRHPSGAIWNEWYLSFPGDHWGWLAEVQGKLYLMFERKLKSDSPLARFDTIELGQSFSVRDETLLVTEKATATVSGAEGEIPWAVRSGLPHTYVDLKSETGSIGTIDFGDKQTKFYLGKEVTLEALGVTPLADLGPTKSIAVQALQVNCPKCAGPLQLFAPDDSLRVTCPNCNALLDASHGKLNYLETLKMRKINSVLALGSKGKLFGREYVVVGFMQRFVKYEGKNYYWTEYLIYNPEVHFRWLVKTDDNHWSFVEQIDFPDSTRSLLTSVVYRGESYRIYDRGEAVVSYVSGEFPWQVQIGERTKSSDFIAPPHMLSIETTIPASEKESNVEVTVSRGVYVPAEEIQQAFGLKELRKPFGVGAIQPAPKMGYRFLISYVAFVAILLAIYLLGRLLQPTRPPDIFMLAVAVGIVTAFPIFVATYLHSFEVQRWRNSDYSPYASGQDS